MNVAVIEDRQESPVPDAGMKAERPHGRGPACPDPTPRRLRTVAARSLVIKLLGRLCRDNVTIIDHDPGSGQVRHFGPGTDRPGSRPDAGGTGEEPEALHATIVVHDARAWTALLSEGSIGLGRGYLEGWWDCADPSTVVRIAIRNMEWLDGIRNRISERTGWVTDRVRSLLPAVTRERNREDIASHYDLGNDFFSIFLDETMTYSSAVFPSPESTLADASTYKYDRLLAKLGMKQEHSLLEIGTGWCGFALRAVERFGCQVTTTTISAEQIAEAKRRRKAAGYTSEIELLEADWRDLRGSFDRIASIEMIEAVDWREYDRFFSTIERCMRPDGLAAIQAICVPDRRYERTKNTEDFIRRFIFRGGFLPSIGAITKSVSGSTRMQVIDVEDISGHYAETLRRWRLRFDERIDEVRELGFDDRFCRMWRFYLAYCEAGFTERHCTVNQIVLAGHDWRPDGLSPRSL